MQMGTDPYDVSSPASLLPPPFLLSLLPSLPPRSTLSSGDGHAHKKKKGINPANFFNPNSTWR